MKKVRKWVYYCEFCGKKKGLSAPHMKTHERRCTANPDRECRLCGVQRTKKDWDKIKILDKLIGGFTPMTVPTNGGVPRYVQGSENAQAIKDLEQMVEGCPVCTFTYLRTQIDDKARWEYNLKEKLDEWWAIHPKE